MTRNLGKGEVESSILSCSTTKPLDMFDIALGALDADCADSSVNNSGTVAGNWQGRFGLYADDRDGWVGYDEPTTLYRYYDADGVLLYIGISVRFSERDLTHFAQTQWRHMAAFVRVEAYPNRDLAEIAEAHAIENEQPEYNAKWPNTREPGGIRRDWYLKKMGGLRGECVQWAVPGHSWPISITPCEPPDWWDDGRVFFIPYSGTNGFRPRARSVPGGVGGMK